MNQYVAMDKISKPQVSSSPTELTSFYPPSSVLAASPSSAMRTCSLNQPSTSLLPVSLYHASASSKPSIQLHFTLPPPSPSTATKHGSHIVSEEPSTITAILAAVALANAAAEAAKDAMSSSLALRDIAFGQPGHGDHDDEDDCLAARRRRRRWKRKDFQCAQQDSSRYLLKGRSTRSERSAYLTRQQEAEFSLYLKEGAILEAASQNSGTREDYQLESAGTRAAGQVERRRHKEEVLLQARECRERIILSYKRLVVSVATQYQGKGLSLQDLIQEGCIGLLRGAQRYDCKKGYKLSTYVYWWIRQAIIRAIDSKSRIIRLPGSISGSAIKVSNANSFLRKQLGRFPSYEEIAELVPVSASSVRLILEKARNPISVDQPINKDGLMLKDIIPGQDETRPEFMVCRQQMFKNLDKLLKSLSEREEYILRLHYGLNGERPLSCEEIARLLNLSRERVRQIHRCTLTKLKEGNDLSRTLDTLLTK